MAGCAWCTGHVNSRPFERSEGVADRVILTVPTDAVLVAAPVRLLCIRHAPARTGSRQATRSAWFCANISRAGYRTIGSCDYRSHSASSTVRPCGYRCRDHHEICMFIGPGRDADEITENIPGILSSISHCTDDLIMVTTQHAPECARCVIMIIDKIVRAAADRAFAVFHAFPVYFKRYAVLMQDLGALLVLLVNSSSKMMMLWTPLRLAPGNRMLEQGTAFATLAVALRGGMRSSSQSFFSIAFSSVFASS